MHEQHSPETPHSMPLLAKPEERRIKTEPEDARQQNDDSNDPSYDGQEPPHAEADADEQDSNAPPEPDPDHDWTPDVTPGDVEIHQANAERAEHDDSAEAGEREAQGSAGVDVADGSTGVGDAQTTGVPAEIGAMQRTRSPSRRARKPSRRAREARENEDNQKGLRS